MNLPTVLPLTLYIIDQFRWLHKPGPQYKSILGHSPTYWHNIDLVLKDYGYKNFLIISLLLTSTVLYSLVYSMFDHANFANNLNKHCNMDIPIILAICAQMHNLETLLRFYISMKSNIFGSWPVANCFHKSID